VSALASVSAAASVAALPLVYATARELYGPESRPLAARAVAVYAFLPPVWFYAGTPITDTAGAAASLLVFWLAVRAMRRSSRLPVALAVFGAACGVRPQSLVPALLPIFLALRNADRRTRLAALGLAIAAAAVFAAAPVVIAAGGIEALLGPVRERITYAGSKTSILSGVDWRYLSTRWLRDPWVSKWLAAAVAALAIAGALRLDRLDRAAGRSTTRLLLASFAPYALLCVVFLDPTFGGRYVLPLMPAVAILAAGAAREIERSLWPSVRLPVVTAALVAACAAAVAPAIRVMHERPAPAEEAASRLRAKIGASGVAPFALLYSEEMYAPTELLFPNVPKFAVEKTSAEALRAATALPVWRFGVGSMTDEEDSSCWPPLPALRRLAPGRYMVVPFGPWSRETPAFLEGWSGEERRPLSGCALQTFRWISAGSPARAAFPALAGPRRLRVDVEPESVRRPPDRLRILWNGSPIGTVSLAGPVSFRARLPRDRGGAGELVLAVESAGIPLASAGGGTLRAAVSRVAVLAE